MIEPGEKLHVPLLESQYDNMQACIRCGLCLSVCPTYQETFSEAESPRGRIAMAKALTEGHLGATEDLIQHEDSCLLCEACTHICPSGVRMEEIGLALRASLRGSAPGLRSGFGESLALRYLLPRMGLFRFVSSLAASYQGGWLQGLARGSGILKLMGFTEAEALLPRMKPPFFVPEGQVWEPTAGEARGQVALFAGCIMSTAFAETDRATARVLAHNGFRVVVAAGQGCCGALHAHRGELEEARALARGNIGAFERGEFDAVIVNAAGCGAFLKGYGQLLRDDISYAQRASLFSQKVKDVTEFLASREFYPPSGSLDAVVTYQDPCHLLHAQGIGQAPRRLLTAIPGLKLVEMAEPALCCGSAGIYNITHPEMSKALMKRKIKNVLAAGAEIVVTANPGCMIQLEAGLREAEADPDGPGRRVRVCHVVDLLDEAYGGEGS